MGIALGPTAEGNAADVAPALLTTADAMLGAGIALLAEMLLLPVLLLLLPALLMLPLTPPTPPPGVLPPGEQPSFEF